MHFATAASNFSASELPKVVPDRQFFNIFTSKCAFRHSAVQFCDIVTSKMLRSWRVLRILTCKCAFRHSGVQFLMSPLSTYLRTRRFNRPTFGLTRHTNLWKNTAFRDFSNIWRVCIVFSSNFLTIASSVDWLDYSTTAFQLSILSEVSI